MVILDPYGMTFDAVGVFGLVSELLFKSCSLYCGGYKLFLERKVPRRGICRGVQKRDSENLAFKFGMIS